MSEPTPQQRATAGAVLRRLKAVVPHKLPKITPDTEDVWAHVIATRPVWPALVWRDAVDFYLAHMANHTGMTLPRDILEAAKVVISRYERDPKLKAQMQAERDKRQQLIDEAVEKQLATSEKEKQ